MQNNWTTHPPNTKPTKRNKRKNNNKCKIIVPPTHQTWNQQKKWNTKIRKKQQQKQEKDKCKIRKSETLYFICSKANWVEYWCLWIIKTLLWLFKSHSFESLAVLRALCSNCMQRGVGGRKGGGGQGGLGWVCLLWTLLPYQLLPLQQGIPTIWVCFHSWI